MAAPRTGYVLESDEEVKRLANQHDVIKDEMGPQGLVLAPIDLSKKPLRILDSATADGTWVQDLAASTSAVHHQFFGTDLDPSNLPSSPPAGQTYQVQDILKPWPAEWKGTFDLVHQRLALVIGGPNQQQILENLGDLVKPGGWIQLIEATNDLPEDTGPAFRNFVTVMKGVITTFGSSLKLADELPGRLREAGFVDVQDRILNTKLGAKNPNPALANQGTYSTTVAARGLASFGATLPEGVIPLIAEQIAAMPEELNAELARDGAIYPLRVVWGRKHVHDCPSS